jgi:hypothetical protein
VLGNPIPVLRLALPANDESAAAIGFRHPTGSNLAIKEDAGVNRRIGLEDRKRGKVNRSLTSRSFTVDL